MVSHASRAASPLAVAEQFSLRLIPANEDDIPTSELLINGSATGTVLNGAVLEAALIWNDHFVVFLTDDMPYEDALHINLLNSKFELLDSASLASMYSTGSFERLQLLPPNRASFRFFGDTDWRIELLAQPAARIPFLSEPAGVKRAFGFSRRFIVQGAPKAE